MTTWMVVWGVVFLLPRPLYSRYRPHAVKVINKKKHLDSTRAVRLLRNEIRMLRLVARRVPQKVRGIVRLFEVYVFSA